MIYYTSDLHLGHSNCIQLCNRPFYSVYEMDQTLIANWNQRVTNSDHIYIMGDLIFRFGKDPCIFLNTWKNICFFTAHITPGFRTVIYEMRRESGDSPMLRMRIGLDVGKIQREGHYDLAAMCDAIDSAFEQVGLIKGKSTDTELFYSGMGDSHDFGRFGKLVNALKKKPWFMESISLWRMYESSDNGNSDDYDEEDLLKHYRD